MVNQTLNIEVYERFNFDISPNPVQNKMNIYFSNNTNDLDVSIYDLTGRRVFYKPSYSLNGNTSIELDVSYLNSGLYLVNITNNEVNVIKRVLKR